MPSTGVPISEPLMLSHPTPSPEENVRAQLHSHIQISSENCGTVSFVGAQIVYIMVLLLKQLTKTTTL